MDRYIIYHLIRFDWIRLIQLDRRINGFYDRSDRCLSQCCVDWKRLIPRLPRKLDELKKLGDPVVFRFKEDEMREDWISAVKGTITNYSNAAKGPGDM